MIITVEYDADKMETVFVRKIRVPDKENADLADWIRLMTRNSTNHAIKANLNDEQWQDLCSRSSFDA